MRLLAGSRCLVNCIAHPGSVVSAHESRPCSSRLHRSSALLIVYFHACCAQVTAIHVYDPWPYNWHMACARCICLLALCLRACFCCRTDTDAVPPAAAPLRPALQTEAHSACCVRVCLYVPVHVSLCPRRKARNHRLHLPACNCPVPESLFLLPH